MDGIKSQAIICKQADIDSGGLSRLIKALKDAGLIIDSDKPPKLSIPIPAKFPDQSGAPNA